jgi:hypothetical protein
MIGYCHKGALGKAIQAVGMVQLVREVYLRVFQQGGCKSSASQMAAIRVYLVYFVNTQPSNDRIPQEAAESRLEESETLLQV